MNAPLSESESGDLSAFAMRPELFGETAFGNAIQTIGTSHVMWAQRLSPQLTQSLQSLVSAIKAGQASALLAVGAAESSVPADHRAPPPDSKGDGGQPKRRLVATAAEVELILQSLRAVVDGHTSSMQKYIAENLVGPQGEFLAKYWGSHISEGDSLVVQSMDAIRKAEAELLYSIWILAVEEEAEMGCFEQASVGRFRYFMEDWKSQSDALCDAMATLQSDLARKSAQAAAAQAKKAEDVAQFTSSASAAVLERYMQGISDAAANSAAEAGAASPPRLSTGQVAFGRAVPPKPVFKSDGAHKRASSPSRKKASDADADEAPLRTAKLGGHGVVPNGKEGSLGIDDSVVTKRVTCLVSILLDIKPVVLKSFVRRLQNEFAALSNSFVSGLEELSGLKSEPREAAPSAALLYGYQPAWLLFSRAVLAAGAMWESCFVEEMRSSFLGAGSSQDLEDDCKAVFSVCCSAMLLLRAKHTSGFVDPAHVLEAASARFYPIVMSALIAVLLHVDYPVMDGRNTFRSDLMRAEEAWMLDAVGLSPEETIDKVSELSPKHFITHLLASAFGEPKNVISPSWTVEGFIKRASAVNGMPGDDIFVLIAMQGRKGSLFDANPVSLRTAVRLWRLSSWAGLYMHLIPVPGDKLPRLSLVFDAMSLRAAESAAEPSDSDALFVECVSPFESIASAYRLITDEIDFLPVSYLQATCFLASDFLGGDPWIVDSSAILGFLKNKSAFKGSIRHLLSEYCAVVFLKQLLAHTEGREGDFAGLEDPLQGGQPPGEGSIFPIGFAPNIQEMLGALDFGNAQLLACELLRGFVQPHVGQLQNSGSGRSAGPRGGRSDGRSSIAANSSSSYPLSFSASSASLFLFVLFREHCFRREEGKQSDLTAGLNSDHPMASDSTNAAGGSLPDLKDRIKSVTVPLVTTSIGCLTIPMNDKDANRMMKKAIQFNKPLHPSHVSSSNDATVAASATIWVFKNAVSWPEVQKTIQGIMSVSVLQNDSMASFLRKLETKTEASRGGLRRGIELWTISIFRAALDRWENTRTRGLDTAVDIAPESDSIIVDEHTAYWNRRSAARVARVKAMTETLHTSIRNYWSTHIYQSRLKRYGLRANLAREAFAKVEQQYASLRAIVLRRQEGMLKSYDKERKVLRQRHDNVLHDTSRLASFYVACFDELRGSLQLGLSALERAIAYIEAELDQVLDSSRSHFRAASVQMVVRRPETSTASTMSCWHVWPSGDDSRAISVVGAKLRGGEDSINNMLLRCTTEIEGTPVLFNDCLELNV